MDVALIQQLLTAIKDAVTANRRQDDVALPVFDPNTSDAGAGVWCDNIDALGEEFGWSSVAKVAKASKALKGSASVWFESWEPQDGRSWENFRSELIALFPEKKNLSEKLYKAVVYNSDSADSYSEYAREKIRLLKCTKLAFTEIQLVELVCGGIRDNNVRMASFNSNVKTTSELISLFTTYVKTKKRQFDNGSFSENTPGPSGVKRFKSGFKPNETTHVRTCFRCGQRGHLLADCLTLAPTSEIPRIQNQKVCTICKKAGHEETTCFFKKRTVHTAELTKPTNKQA